MGTEDTGSGTVLVTGLVTALLVGALATAALGQAALARHRAAAAADLAALAAAQAGWGLAGPGACSGDVLAVATRVAAANRARLAGCEVGVDATVSVTAVVPVHGVAAGLGPARGTARAGPAP